MQTHSENLTEPLNISKDLSIKNILAKDHQKDQDSSSSRISYMWILPGSKTRVAKVPVSRVSFNRGELGRERRFL